MKSFKILKLAVAGLLAAGLVACGGGGDAPVASSGTLRMALTDAPSCGYDSVNVTIQKIRVHQSSSANDTDSGWSEIVLSPARRLDLLSLTNGVLSELGQTPLPTGKYTQLRLVLAGNDSTTPLANSVKPTGSAEVALKTPSGQESGVKTNIDIDIGANKMADFVLDFDACKSVVVAGGSGQYLLKPVVKVIPRYISGVTGFVATNSNTGVSLQQGGVVVKATAPDSTGKFLLQPVAPGNYTLVVTAPGYTTAIVTSVAVTTDTVTPVNVSGSAIRPAASATTTVSGTAAANTTLVRVMQQLSSPTTVEVAARSLDNTMLAYSFVLPTNAPVIAPYVAGPGTLVFVPDTAAAGKYFTIP